MKGQKIGYIRVSTVEQNTTRQLEGIELDRVFIDKCSGKDTNRPELTNLLQFVRDGDTIFVHSMDRLARNVDDLRKLVNKITDNNITITFLKENLTFSKDDKNPISKLILSVVGSIAEFERSLIKERQLEGIAIAKKANKYKGRIKSLNKDQISEIQQMIANRYKKADIAKKFGIHYVTLYRYMKEHKLTADNKISETPKVEPSQSKAIKIILTFNIDNNSNFVRGKKKTKEDIEMSVLSNYTYQKTDNYEYIITLRYSSDDELNTVIDDIANEIHSQADIRNCFVEDIIICTTDKKRYWDVY